MLTCSNVCYAIMLQAIYSVHLAEKKFQSMDTFLAERKSSIKPCFTFTTHLICQRSFSQSQLINIVELDNCMDGPFLRAKPSEMFILPFSESAPGQSNQGGEGESSWPEPEQLSSLITQILSLDCRLLHPGILIRPIQPSMITTAHTLSNLRTPPSLPVSILHILALSYST